MEFNLLGRRPYQTTTRNWLPLWRLPTTEDPS